MEDIEKAMDALLRASRVVVLTGAGISAESGVPTFRGEDGLWKNYRPEELATPGAFARNPELVWEWYYWRRSIIGKAEPNPGHLALKTLEDRLLDRFFLITQNVDGLHRKAGNERLVEFHGNIWINRCTRCGNERFDDTVKFEGLPTCPGCGSLERPGVVWFGEAIPSGVIRISMERVRSCDVCLVVGTSGVVQPAASLADAAKVSGAFIIEVNPQATPISYTADVSLRGKAGEVLPQLVSQ